MSKSILSDNDINHYLQPYKNWRYDSVKKSLCFSYKFDNFSACFAMMVQIAMLAERHNHHPDWFNSYGKLDIALTSHDVQGVTKRDVDMMAMIAKLFADLA